MNIAPGREPSFIVLFLAQFIFFLAVLISQNDYTGWEAVKEIGKDLSRLVLLMTATSYVGVESVTMIAEAFLKKREEKGREANEKKWQEWLEKQPQEVKDKFTTPPPINRSNGS